MKNKSQKKSKKSKNVKKVQNFEINLHETMDASVWAREYKRRFGGKKSLLMGWFANAIMCGWDHGVRQCENEALKVIIPNASGNIEHVTEEYDAPAAFSSAEERSLTISAAQAINDFLKSSEKHTVSMGENFCDFFDDYGKSLICRVSSCSLSVAVETCYEEWIRETAYFNGEDWDWPWEWAPDSDTDVSENKEESQGQ